MSLAAFSIRQPVLVNLLAVGVVIAGTAALADMSREGTPEVEMGAAQIFAAYPGASAEEVEALIALPIEAAVTGLPDVDHVITTSREGVATLWVEFSPRTPDITRAVLRVQSAVQSVRDYPTDAERPLVVQRTVNIPTLTVAIGVDAEGEAANALLRESTELVQSRLAQIPGVADITPAGVGERAIFVDVDPDLLAAHRVPLEAVASALVPRANDVPAGLVSDDQSAQLVRGVARAATEEEVRSVVVRPRPVEAVVRVADVAAVHEGTVSPRITARANGEPGVILLVYKRHDADSMRISESVHALLESGDGLLPEGVHTQVMGDLAPRVEASLDALYENAALGLVFVVALLWMFVGGRNALMTALGIPVALAGALMTMAALGVSLNSLSLMALILCLGIVVDDAIILVENIYRHLEEGAGRVEAAIKGTEEVLIPVAASTLTTCAAFAPLLFMTGVFGSFFSIIPKVVIAALVASLAEALVVLPSHMADFGATPDRRERPRTRLERFWARVSARGTQGYARLLDRSLRHPWAVVLGAYALCAGLVAAAALGKDVVLLNDGDVDAIDVRVRMPSDASHASTERALAEIDRRILDLGSPDVAELFSLAGFTRTEMWAQTGDHLGMATLRLVDADQRSAPDAGARLVDSIRAALSDLVGPERISVTPFVLGPPRGAPFALRISSEDRGRALDAAETIISSLRRVPGVVDVGHDAGMGKLEVVVEPDEDRATHHGLSSAEIVRWLRLALGQNTVARTREGDDPIRMVVRLSPDAVEDPTQVGALRMLTPAGVDVALHEVADLRPARSIAVARRRDGEQQINVTAEIDPEVTTGQAVADAFAAQLPVLQRQFPNVRFHLGGELERIDESLRSLARAFVAAILLIYGILAAQFRSFIQPLIVMAAVPLSLIGVVVGFFLTAEPVGLIALVGVVGLAGIVVNDSLVMVEFINQRREAGLSVRDAILEAGRLRLRPILLTSVTTVGGLLPLALAGNRAPLLAPMANAISWGLTFATGLTLVAVPCLYLLVDRAGSALAARFEPLRGRLMANG